MHIWCSINVADIIILYAISSTSILFSFSSSLYLTPSCSHVKSLLLHQVSAQMPHPLSRVPSASTLLMHSLPWTLLVFTLALLFPTPTMLSASRGQSQDLSDSQNLIQPCRLQTLNNTCQSELNCNQKAHIGYG